MFNEGKFDSIITEYKKQFIQSQWPKEKFKWEAVKCFQDNWDINANDFIEMLKKSLAKTENLLSSKNNFPKDTIINLAKLYPNEVCKMFIELFDESKNIYERISTFKENSEALFKKSEETDNRHYQTENAITIYLWLRYPDKYYIYKFSDVVAVSNKLESNYIFKRGEFANNIENFFDFYDEICLKLQSDTELKSMLNSVIADTCYPDLELKTLTIDVGFFISRYYSNENDSDILVNEWEPTDYSPKLSIENWENLLNDPNIFDENSLKVMKCIKDCGGIASCTQLSRIYGNTINFYNTTSSNLAKRIIEKTGCPKPASIKNNKWWPVLYLGRFAEKNEEGSFIWKLRDELSEALNKVDLSKIEICKSSSVSELNYWLLTADPQKFSLVNASIGEIIDYSLRNSNGNKRRIFQNFLNAKEGDIVFGYEFAPTQKIVAILEVSAEQDDENIYFKKLETLSSPISLEILEKYVKLKNMEFFKNMRGTLFKITEEEFEIIMDIICKENPSLLLKYTDDYIDKNIISEASTNLSLKQNRKYTKEDFLKDVYISEEKYDKLVNVLKRKKNIILQGAPGVGKTFLAKRLAYSIMGEKDEERVKFIQFHQNYSYEDFVMGYKPVEEGFELKYGIFYNFCKKAAENLDKDYFFIIDEINRGNLSKIFGELLMLIEADYRDEKATLAYTGSDFSVPKNLHIIGMMNIADRSLAMIDYALRRRFSFFDIEPAFDSEGFSNYQKEFSNKTFNELIEKIKKLNEAITQDQSLGKGFCIGHSYFYNAEECTVEWMKDIVDFDILPMLSEYWFDDEVNLNKWKDILYGVFE
ncbi:restriction endonuclease [Fusobacterium pseudoperiodonticum]|uniref:Restriction endonuclease n=1 Tax=Fusobacterium pseudoperiodonticum TaxID=2663009 RepID=A0AAD0API0_9FUSO|nr:AAA family ATPase [Fusobacterium pseudoperiodonticum]ATV65175.1 restriction endonuclease [Fusobacterium pseudoperiodonticum]